MSFFANWCRFPSSASIRFLSVVHLLWAIGNKLVSLFIVSNRLVRSQRSFQPSLVKLVLLTIIVCYVFNPSTTEGLMKLERPIVWQAEHSLSTHPVAGGLMKLLCLFSSLPLRCLSTHPVAGGLMKLKYFDRRTFREATFNPPCCGRVDETCDRLCQFWRLWIFQPTLLREGWWNRARWNPCLQKLRNTLLSADFKFFISALSLKKTLTK